ncbi:uncharacterized protein LOC121863569 isoform X6 [Homarus americanus]|uniref:uncharacterized protein LOC121863569 isoform X6 n=1 Tax=Homarus americanus TaxID=6706 RepID=UPI001C46AD9E|nr:uncharacterized protein LOC121863569 isoform X6 [Homarus americanus]
MESEAGHDLISMPMDHGPAVRGKMPKTDDDIRSHPTSRVSPDHSLRGGCHPVKRKKLLSVSHLLIHQHRFQLYCHKLQKANKIVEESRTTSSGPSHTTSSSLPWVIPPPTKYVDPLNCKMCEKRYNTSDRRPRTLRCGHTFCTHCLTPTGLLTQKLLAYKLTHYSTVQYWATLNFYAD